MVLSTHCGQMQASLVQKSKTIQGACFIQFDHWAIGIPCFESLEGVLVEIHQQRRQRLLRPVKANETWQTTVPDDLGCLSQPLLEHATVYSCKISVVQARDQTQ